MDIFTGKACDLNAGIHEPVHPWSFPGSWGDDNCCIPEDLAHDQIFYFWQPWRIHFIITIKDKENTFLIGSDILEKVICWIVKVSWEKQLIDIVLQIPFHLFKLHKQNKLEMLQIWTSTSPIIHHKWHKCTLSNTCLSLYEDAPHLGGTWPSIEDFNICLQGLSLCHSPGLSPSDHLEVGVNVLDVDKKWFVPCKRLKPTNDILVQVK